MAHLITISCFLFNYYVIIKYVSTYKNMFYINTFKIKGILMKKMLLMALVAVSIVGSAFAGCGTKKCGSCPKKEAKACCPAPITCQRMVAQNVAPIKEHACPSYSCPTGSTQV